MGTEEKNNNYTPSSAPVGQLPTTRNLIKFILFSIITLGIYALYFYSVVSSHINIIASRYDGRKTMHFIVAVLLSCLTFAIVGIVWMHRVSNRIGGELNRRGIEYSFGAGTFWLWSVLGSLIIVGPFIYIYKLCNSMNKLSEHYNING